MGKLIQIVKPVNAAEYEFFSVCLLKIPFAI
ncbi:MAG: hypothetical protein ACJAU1_001247 [Psychromonas sp.]|jgi:hypothetical protein